MIALHLAKQGFGTIEGILEMRTDLVLDAAEFTRFLGDYEESAIELNKSRK